PDYSIRVRGLRSRRPPGRPPVFDATSRSAAALSYRRRPSQRPAAGDSTSQPILRSLQLPEHLGGQPRPLLPHAGPDVGYFLLPESRVRSEQGVQRLSTDVEARGVQVLCTWQTPDRGLLRADFACAPIQHPLEHSQVLTEARPEELAGRIAPEPVDVEY